MNTTATKTTKRNETSAVFFFFLKQTAEPVCVCVFVFQLESFHTVLENSNNDFCLKIQKKKTYLCIEKKAA